MRKEIINVLKIPGSHFETWPLSILIYSQTKSAIITGRRTGPSLFLFIVRNITARAIVAGLE